MFFALAPHSSARHRDEELGLLDLAHSPLDQLSGGQRQQAGIARTLVQDAPLIVLDELLSSRCGESGEGSAENWQLRDAGYGVIFTTHKPDHALVLTPSPCLAHTRYVLTPCAKRALSEKRRCRLSF